MIGFFFSTNGSFTHGTAGYVLKKDLNGEQPKSPQDAIAIQNSRSLGGRAIPLYDVEGATVIGVFHVGGK
ncbi:hypothetical protein [Paenibacillus sp. NPDC093718]|uniref:hypothetical protein n=1 Tax=Paenibacillus sp. NPDC093718 TaxID=3390601 RepID=UPI003D093610